MNYPAEEEHIHALLVDDDLKLQSSIRDFMEAYGFRVSTRDNGKDIETAIDGLMPDIVLLDVMLPGEDGFSVLRRLRTVSRIPVIMLTARGNETDRIVGLEMGADDYLPKPFNPRELMARIKAVLRRVYEPQESPAPASGQAEGMLTVGAIQLDLRRQRLHSGGSQVDLSTTEFRIIKALMSHADEVLSRDEIQTLAFGENFCCNDRHIDVYVSRARRTVRGLSGLSPIHTVWGAGYRWVGED